MNNREKRIVIATCIVALAAGIFLFFDHSGNKPSDSRQPVVSTQANMASVAAIKPISAREKKIIRLSNSSWQEGILYVPEPPPEQSKVIEKSLFQYSGFLDIGASQYAIINDKRFVQGDNLSSIGWKTYTLKHIATDSIVLIDPKGKSLLIKYKEKIDAMQEIGNKNEVSPTNETL